MKFRAGVYGNRQKISAGCQVLLLRLSDSMDAKCIVSVPRSQLAAELGCPPARITEWVQAAREAGFLSTVRRARPKVTAVYQGMYVNPLEVRPAVPHQRYGNPDPTGVRPAVPLDPAQRYAQGGSQEVEPQPSVESRVYPFPQRGSDEESA